MKHHPSHLRRPVLPGTRSVKADASVEPEFFSSQISQADRFFLDLDPPAGQRLAVVCGGGEHCQPEYHLTRTDFAYYSIEFVAGGEGKLTLAGKTHDLMSGAVFAYGPGIGQDIRCNPARPLVKYFVDFVGEAALPLLSPPGPAPGGVVQSSAPEDLLRLFDDLIAAGMRRSPFSSRICAAILEQMLLRLAETSVALGAVGSLAFETYQTCRQFIESHYLELGGLAETAERCHVDAAYLCRLYARFDYQSPYQHLLRLKMRRAAQRLREPGVLAKEVAAEMGFADPFQFSRTFRRIIGVSPRQIMNMQRPMVGRLMDEG